MWMRHTERVVETEIETTVHNDTDNRGHETTVQTRNTIGSKGLLVDINETVELAGAATLRRFRIVGETGTCVVKGVHKEERGGTSSTTRRKVTSEPLPVSLRLLETEQRLEVILFATFVN